MTLKEELEGVNGMSCVDNEGIAFCRRELPLQASLGRRVLSEFQEALGP